MPLPEPQLNLQDRIIAKACYKPHYRLFLTDMSLCCTVYKTFKEEKLTPFFVTDRA